ncbi:hypothetical protein ACLESD_32770, partial [Pyxidicoccus sp. 3LFB2]
MAPLSGADAQLALARETLEAVRSQSLSTREGGVIPWSAFWAEPRAGAAGAFGAYGAVGNAFGQAEVRWKGRTHPVDSASVDAFMDARVAAAVAYTRAFLEWAAARFEAESAPDSPGLTLLRGFRPPPELSLQGWADSHGTRAARPRRGLRATLPMPHALTLSV